MGWIPIVALAAALAGGQGDVQPYFVKLVGPARTVARWRDAVGAFLESARFA